MWEPLGCLDQEILPIVAAADVPESHGKWGGCCLFSEASLPLAINI